MTDSMNAISALSLNDLRSLQGEKWQQLVGAINKTNAFCQQRLWDAAPPHSESWTAIPFTTRKDIEQDQVDHPPYGTNLTFPLEHYVRHHQTSGSSGTPVRWLDTTESWDWVIGNWDYVFDGAEVRRRDRIAFPFSFGPFLGFWSALECALRRGNFCIPAGGMTSRARLEYFIDHQATVICCTPTYALHLAQIAEQESIDITSSPVRALIVAGEPGGSIPTIRRRIEDAWNARVFDHVGMTEIGPWGYECTASPGDVHIIESEFIAEAVDPNSGEPVPDNAVGELVLTNLGRIACPLIRYRTGDLVRVNSQPCPCGCTFRRVAGGVLGRRDDMLTIRGNNVFPTAIDALIRDFAEIDEFRVTVHDMGSVQELEIEIECTAARHDGQALATKVVDAVRNRHHFRPTVRTVPGGTLPRFEMKARRWVRQREEA